MLVQPKLSLDRDTTVTVDARRTRPVDVTVPDTAAKNTEATAFFASTGSRGRARTAWRFSCRPSRARASDGSDPSRPVTRRPPCPPCSPATGPARTTEGRPVTYHLAWNRAGRLDGFAADIRRNQLAKVDLQVGVPVEGRRVQVEASAHTADGSLVFTANDLRGELPLRTTDYVLDNGVKWSFRTWQTIGEGDEKRSRELPDADAEDLAGRSQLHRAVQRRRVRPGPARRG